MNRTMIGAAAILSLSGLAFAQSAGDILFVSNNFTRTQGAQPDTIGFIPSAGGAATTLFSEMGTRYRHVNTGPGGGYYFSDATAFPSTPTSGAFFEINGLFSGFGTRNDIATGGFVNSPLDFTYHSPSASFLLVNNPSGTGVVDNPEDGISSVTLGGSATQIFQEIGGQAPPRYDAGVDIVADPARPGSYYVLTLNDGVGPGNSDGAPSVLHRMTVNSDLSSVTMEVLQDLSASVTGLTNDITFATSIDVDPATGDVLVTGGRDDGNIYRVSIDGSGDSAGVSVFADIRTIQTGLGFTPGALDEIEWDPFNNRWILAEFLEDGGFSRISTIGADGVSGYAQLATGFGVNDIIVIPTPGAISVLGLAGFAAMRRRRSA